MPIARKIAYNVMVSSLSKILATILALVSIGFITRYLGTNGFGEYATVLAFSSFFSAIADLGLYQISTREISRRQADEKKVIGNIFSLRILASLVVVLAAPLIVLFLPYPLMVKQGILIVALSFLFSSSYQILNGVFQKNLAMDKVVFGELIGKVVQVAVVMLAVKLDLGFLWIISALLCYMIVSFGIIFCWSKKYIHFNLQFDFAYWKSFLKESLPMGAVAIITFVYFKMDTIMLSFMKSSSDVGIYNAAYKVLENITFFPAMVAGLVMPLMAKNIFFDRMAFEEIANKTFKFFFILIVPLIVGALFLSDGIIGLISGNGFAESADVLRILVFALAFIFFGHFFNIILIVGNLQKKLMSVLLIAALINLSLNYFFIPRFSYIASAWVSVLTEFSVVVFTATLVFQKIKYFPKREKVGRAILAGLAMSVFLFVFKGQSFFLLAFGSTLVYFVFLWLLKVVRTEEILSLISKKGVEEYEELP
jgi:O-antigen/teichoic acid export membrane protein